MPFAVARTIGRKRRFSSLAPDLAPRRRTADCESVEELAMVMGGLTFRQHTTTYPKATTLATRFADLPNEIQSEILSHLPAKEIQRARRINKHTRDLVDEPHNSTLLYTRGQTKERARLQADVDYCMNYNNITFLEALSRFFERRGISRTRRDHSIRNLDVFVHLWASQHGRICPDYVDYRADSQPLFRKAAYSLLIMHLVNRFLGPDRASAHLQQQIMNRKRFFTHNSQTTLMRSWVQDIEERGVFNKAPKSKARQLKIPRWPLTQLTYVDYDKPVPPRPQLVSSGVCGDTSLAELLDIPYLPNYSNGSFAYCVRSKRAYDMVKKGRKNGELTGVEKLAVAEETFLF